MASCCKIRGQGPASRSRFLWVFLLIAAICLAPIKPARTESHHVWEKIDIVLQADSAFANPYTDVQVWVDLEGPGFKNRCYGFWDRDQRFCVRVLATEPGDWSWRSGSDPSDAQLSGQSGSFTAQAWSEADKALNPCRRGMIKPSTNGHAFTYADGEPFFLRGDTWWPASTFRYRWYDDNAQRPIGPTPGSKTTFAFVANRASTASP